MTGKQVVCGSDTLIEKGRGHRFYVRIGERTLPAFVVRNEGKACAYLNKCAHQSVELDWQKGEFFDNDRRYLVCATHGALYHPDTGACAHGCCDGRGLIAIEVCETGGEILLNGENGIHLAPEPETQSPDD
jgi:nitrite reductase/ring-hydroxylating ferredoxin subunit